MTHPKRILIIGDAGRGKSTLAEKISNRLDLPMCSLDDLLWKKKYSIRNEKDISIGLVKDIYKTDTWIVEGATTYLVAEGVERAELIVHLVFPTLLSQWQSIIKRSKKEEQNSIFRLIYFLVFVARKRYGIGYKSNRVKRKELLGPYSKKTVYLKSYKEIDQFLIKIS